MEYSTCRERGTKKKSESPTGIEPMTFRTPVGRSNHRATGRLMASIGDTRRGGGLPYESDGDARRLA